MRKQSGSASVSFLLSIGLLLAGCAPSGSPIEQAEDRRVAHSAVLLGALVDGDPATRERAALAMGRIQHASYTAALIDAAAPSEPKSVRAASLFALGQYGLASGARPSPEALAACRQAAAESDVEIVALAVEALGKLADMESAATLTGALRHADSNVRAEAANALFRLRFVPTWRGEAESAPELPDDAVAALTQALSDPEPAVRLAAAHAFSRFAEPRAAAALTARLAQGGRDHEDDEWFQLFAIRALGRIADPAAAAPILRFVDDESPGLRTAAVSALAAIAAVGQLPPAVLFDESFQVRAAAARAWQTADDEPTIEFLRRLSQDASPTVRGAAIEALAARLGDAYAVGLKFHMKVEDGLIRAAVARATASLPERGLELARDLLSDDDIRVQTAALQALKDRPEMQKHLIAALTSDDLALRGTAVELISAGDHGGRAALLRRAYANSLGDTWIEVRETIVDTVAELEPESDFIEEVYRQDPAMSVRAKARLALEQRGIDLPAIEPPAVTPSRWLGKSSGEDPVVVLETSKGEIEIHCHAADAPVHVANFVQLVRDGFYDGLAWHRVVPGFVIQGGDPRGDGWGSGGIVLRDEINRRRLIRGAVGMPKAGKDTGGCQIFITHVPTPHLDGNYTVFGQVVRGLDVVDSIEVGDRIQRAFLKQGG